MFEVALYETYKISLQYVKQHWTNLQIGSVLFLIKLLYLRHQLRLKRINFKLIDIKCTKSFTSRRIMLPILKLVHMIRTVK